MYIYYSVVKMFFFTDKNVIDSNVFLLYPCLFVVKQS